MSFEIILLAVVLIVVGITLYIIKFKDASGRRIADSIFDKLKPGRVETRKETKQKEGAWENTINDMTLSELNDLRSKLIKKNSLLMKTGRDMKIIEAQQELHIKQRKVEEKIRRANSKEA
jgi:hypothetical protein